MESNKIISLQEIVQLLFLLYDRYFKGLDSENVLGAMIKFLFDAQLMTSTGFSILDIEKLKAKVIDSKTAVRIDIEYENFYDWLREVALCKYSSELDGRKALHKLIVEDILPLASIIEHSPEVTIDTTYLHPATVTVLTEFNDFLKIWFCSVSIEGFLKLSPIEKVWDHFLSQPHKGYHNLVTLQKVFAISGLIPTYLNNDILVGLINQILPKAKSHTNNDNIDERKFSFNDFVIILCAISECISLNTLQTNQQNNNQQGTPTINSNSKSTNGTRQKSIIFLMNTISTYIFEIFLQSIQYHVNKKIEKMLNITTTTTTTTYPMESKFQYLYSILFWMTRQMNLLDSGKMSLLQMSQYISSLLNSITANNHHHHHHLTNNPISSILCKLIKDTIIPNNNNNKISTFISPDLPNDDNNYSTFIAIYSPTMLFINFAFIPTILYDFYQLEVIQNIQNNLMIKLEVIIKFCQLSHTTTKYSNNNNNNNNNNPNNNKSSELSIRSFIYLCRQFQIIPKVISRIEIIGDIVAFVTGMTPPLLQQELDTVIITSLDLIEVIFILSQIIYNTNNYHIEKLPSSFRIINNEININNIMNSRRITDSFSIFLSLFDSNSNHSNNNSIYSNGSITNSQIIVKDEQPSVHSFNVNNNSNGTYGNNNMSSSLYSHKDLENRIINRNDINNNNNHHHNTSSNIQREVTLAELAERFLPPSFLKLMTAKNTYTNYRYSSNNNSSSSGSNSHSSQPPSSNHRSFLLPSSWPTPADSSQYFQILQDLKLLLLHLPLSDIRWTPWRVVEIVHSSTRPCYSPEDLTNSISRIFQMIMLQFEVPLVDLESFFDTLYDKQDYRTLNDVSLPVPPHHTLTRFTASQQQPLEELPPMTIYSIKSTVKNILADSVLLVVSQNEKILKALSANYELLLWEFGRSSATFRSSFTYSTGQNNIYTPIPNSTRCSTKPRDILISNIACLFWASHVAGISDDLAADQLERVYLASGLLSQRDHKPPNCLTFSMFVLLMIRCISFESINHINWNKMSKDQKVTEILKRIRLLLERLSNHLSAVQCAVGIKLLRPLYNYHQNHSKASSYIHETEALDSIDRDALCRSLIHYFDLYSRYNDGNTSNDNYNSNQDNISLQSFELSIQNKRPLPSLWDAPRFLEFCKIFGIIDSFHSFSILWKIFGDYLKLTHNSTYRQQWSNTTTSPDTVHITSQVVMQLLERVSRNIDQLVWEAIDRSGTTTSKKLAMSPIQHLYLNVIVPQIASIADKDVTLGKGHPRRSALLEMNFAGSRITIQDIFRYGGDMMATSLITYRPWMESVFRELVEASGIVFIEEQLPSLSIVCRYLGCRGLLRNTSMVKLAMLSFHPRYRKITTAVNDANELNNDQEYNEIGASLAEFEELLIRAAMSVWINCGACNGNIAVSSSFLSDMLHGHAGVEAQQVWSHYCCECEVLVDGVNSGKLNNNLFGLAVGSWGVDFLTPFVRTLRVFGVIPFVSSRQESVIVAAEKKVNKILKPPSSNTAPQFLRNSVLSEKAHNGHSPNSQGYSNTHEIQEISPTSVNRIEYPAGPGPGPGPVINAVDSPTSDTTVRDTTTMSVTTRSNELLAAILSSRSYQSQVPVTGNIELQLATTSASKPNHFQSTNATYDQNTLLPSNDIQISMDVNGINGHPMTSNGNNNTLPVGRILTGLGSVVGKSASNQGSESPLLDPSLPIGHSGNRPLDVTADYIRGLGAQRWLSRRHQQQQPYQSSQSPLSVEIPDRLPTPDSKYTITNKEHLVEKKTISSALLASTYTTPSVVTTTTTTTTDVAKIKEMIRNQLRTSLKKSPLRHSTLLDGTRDALWPVYATFCSSGDSLSPGKLSGPNLLALLSKLGVLTEKALLADVGMLLHQVTAHTLAHSLITVSSTVADDVIAEAPSLSYEEFLVFLCTFAHIRCGDDVKLTPLYTSKLIANQKDCPPSSQSPQSPLGHWFEVWEKFIRNSVAFRTLLEQCILPRLHRSPFLASPDDAKNRDQYAPIFSIEVLLIIQSVEDTWRTVYSNSISTYNSSIDQKSRLKESNSIRTSSTNLAEAITTSLVTIFEKLKIIPQVLQRGEVRTYLDDVTPTPAAADTTASRSPVSRAPSTTTTTTATGITPTLTSDTPASSSSSSMSEAEAADTFPSLHLPPLLVFLQWEWVVCMAAFRTVETAIRDSHSNTSAQDIAPLIAEVVKSMKDDMIRKKIYL